MNTDHTLEFDKIRQKWKNLALTKAASDRIDSQTFYLNEKELVKNLQDTTDARQFIESCGMPPMSSADEAKELVFLEIGRASCRERV